MAHTGVRGDVDVESLWDAFHAAVNMTSRELQDWLQTQSAGADGESLPDQVEPHLGRRVVEILGKRRTDLTDDDLDVMRHVVEIVRQRDPDPETADAGDDRWRRRLMSVGHDPLKAGR